jgi:metal-responsive CopG/Arc/MetJ family transcriptional regulator
MAMRVHITLETELVERIDRKVGPRRRSTYIAQAVRHALDDEHRWELIESAIGSISDHGHDWDTDPAHWVRDQRHADERRIG